MAVTFPTPVGGTALPADFAPSVLFAALYGLLTPLIVYRMYDKRSRTLLLTGTLTFTVERLILFSLRAVQAHNEQRRFSKGLITYMQLTLGLGYIGIANDLVNLMRCYLVNPTYGSETYAQSPAAATKGYLGTLPPPGTPDRPRWRFWSRRLSDFTNLAFLAAVLPGTFANTNYKSVFDNSREGDKTMRLRYASSAVALFLTYVVILHSTLWARSKLPRVSERGASLIVSLAIVLTVPAVYRLAVMKSTTTSLSSTGPGSLNSPGAKACFYLFHVLPEWFATVMLLATNVRQTLGTGMLGDWRSRDETPKERETRERKKAKREEKKKERMLTEGKEKF